MALGRNEVMKKDQYLARLKQRTAKPGEVYAFYVEMLGKYGTCQILAVDGKSIAMCCLIIWRMTCPEKIFWSGYNRITVNLSGITIR